MTEHIELAPSAGSRLSYEQVLLGGDPQEPRFIPGRDEPTIYHSDSNPTHLTLTLPDGASPDDYPAISLVRRGESATQAYGIFEEKMISLNHHFRGWGCVYPTALVYNRVGQSNTYEAPTLESARYVAIKKLRCQAIRQYLRRGGDEDPYLEIARMQELGDDIHVLSCIEALEDDDKENGFLYIVMPKASAEGSLKDAIPWWSPETMDRERIRNIYRKILQILLYLEKKGICHRDLSPDNFLFLAYDNLVACDLALSIRIPENKNGQRTLITDQGSAGTRAWMAPERFHGRTFDGVYTDLWQAGVILYNMLTNQILYRIPDPADNLFLYFIIARGLSSIPNNEMTADVLSQFYQPGQNEDIAVQLLNRAISHLAFSPSEIEALEHQLVVNVRERWTLAQAIESRFVRGDD